MHLKVAVRAGIIAAFLSIAALVALPARAQEQPTPPPTISITGSAEIAVKPDRARVTSGVVTEAETARQALDANNTALTEVIEAIRQAGIARSDIQTSGFSVEPRYHYPNARDGARPEEPRIVGYTVTNNVTILVRDLDVLGRVLDETVTVGANRIGGIAFEVGDADRRLDEARADAVADARRKAEIYAEAAGVALGGVLSISEAGGAQPPRPMMYAMRAEAADSSVPVEAGEQRLGVRVNVTWRIGE